MIWAVLDTNAIVSGMLRGRNPGRVLELGVQGQFVMVTSRPLLDELARVVQYEKLAPFFHDPLSTVLLIQCERPGGTHNPRGPTGRRAGQPVDRSSPDRQR
ncbi:MAG: putative toxin-antitoxin system toxin component, PIN family [Actinomycetota bacterium]